MPQVTLRTVSCLDNPLDGRGSVGVTIGGTDVRDISRTINRTIRPPLLVNQRITIVVLNRETKTSRIDVLVAPDEESTEDGLREEVEHAVENGFGVGRDDVAAFCEAPGYGVKDPFNNMLVMHMYV